MSLKKLTKQRQGLHLNVHNIMKELATLTDPSVPEVNFRRLQTLRASLTEFQKRIDDLDNRILSLVDEDDDAAMDKECEESLKWARDIVEALADLDAFLTIKTQVDMPNASSANTDPPSANQHNNVNATLPKLNVQSFGGDPLQWMEFWDTFSSTIHDRTDMKPVEKLKYLKSYLTGEAKEVISGYRTQDSTYDVVVKLLEERYGNEQIAIHAHMEKLLAVSMDQAKQNPLQHVYYECEKHIRSLVAYGLTEDTFGKVFTPVILHKLPKGVLATLHREKGDGPWDLQTLRKLLRTEIEARESSERYAVAKPVPQTRSQMPRNYGQDKPKSNPIFRPTQGTMTHQTTPSTPCPFCEKNHYATDCKKYKNVDERKAALNGACQKCLHKGHSVNTCQKRRGCYYCRSQQHHSSLCPDTFGESRGTHQAYGDSRLTQPTGRKEYKPAGAHTKSQPSYAGENSSNLRGKRVQLQMAVVRFANQVEARIFFDSGCSRSYVTRKLIQQLHVSEHAEEVLISSKFGERTRSFQKYGCALFPLPTLRDGTFHLEVLVTDYITCPLQKYPIDESKNPILTQITLADTTVCDTEDVEVDVVIGQDYLYDILGTEKLKLANGMYLIDSRLGYVLSGIVPNGECDNTASLSFVSQMNCTTTPAKDLTEQMWSLDLIGIKDDPYQADDDKAIKYFTETIQRDKAGRYEVRWPWKDDEPKPPSNFGLAIGSLKSLAKRLQRTPKLLTDYDKVLNDQLVKGIIEECHFDVADGPVTYLPHHAVVREDKETTKLRIVYNASAKGSRSERSLNECLMRGAVLLRNLVGILLRFRRHNIAITADIEKAFLQVGLQRTERDVTRFLWLRDPLQPVSPQNIIIYRFTRVPFGFGPSSFLLDATTEFHLSTLDGEVPADVSQNTYVDNLASGQPTLESAIEYYRQAKAIFTSISMNLREWYSNSKAFRTNLAENDIGKSEKPKVLGLEWNTSADTFSCTGFTNMCRENPTKRKLAQSLATVYDPCGFFSPVLLEAKTTIQQMWKDKIPWDGKLPDETSNSCTDLCRSLDELHKVSVPRRVETFSTDTNVKYELHCFSDASGMAYGACVYLRSVSSNGKCETNLIFSKMRLATIKPISIPRLELLGAVIGCRILQLVKDELQLPLGRIILWSDSKCTLSWIHTDRLLTVFVENRVRELRSLDKCEYRYVPTKLNPADILSRGMTPAEIATSQLWWKGPQFLTLDETMWPENTFARLEKMPEARGVELSMPALPRRGIGEIIDAKRFSSTSKLLRVTCYVLRMLGYSKERGPVTIVELKAAEQRWLKYVQEPLISEAKKHPKRSKFRDLNAYADEQGIIRCKGRFEHSTLPRMQREPILLPHPQDSAFAELVIKTTHEKVLHAGTSQTLSTLREQYWIPRGRDSVRKCIRKCPHCRRIEGGPFKVPGQPALPPFRVAPAPPFTTSGVDYLGPLQVQAFGNTDLPVQKVWIALFTCAVTRAIHLEVATDNSADQFLMCLRRFVAFYGAPQLMISDNASNFRLTQSVIRSVQTAQSLQSYSAERGIQWKFIPELSPWMGGFYERLVGTVKRSLRKVLGPKCLTLVQLQTLVAEVAALVNTRPLTSTDPGSPDLALTPAHFLAKGPRAGLSYANFPDATHQVTNRRQEVLESWKKGQRIMDEFWKCWSRHYLCSLRERSATNLNSRNANDTPIKIGMVVLLQDSRQRVYWSLATVKQLVTSRDGLVRSAVVQTANGKALNRPLKLLHPLEDDVPDDRTIPNAKPRAVHTRILFRGRDRRPTADADTDDDAMSEEL